MSTTVAHKRQRSTSDWQEVHIHADIHENMDDKIDRRTKTKQDFEISVPLHGIGQNTPDKHAIEAEQDNHPD